MHGRSYGPGSDEPPCNLIINAASHVSVLKACKYLDIQPRVIPLGSGRYTMDSDLVEKAMDDNTIGVSKTKCALDLSGTPSAPDRY